MSSEVCPFCGKTYKRLKSHLPHCKAAAVSKTPLSQCDVTGNQTSSQLDTCWSKTKAKGKKTTLLTTHTLNTEVSAVSSGPSEETSSSPQTPSLSLSSSLSSSPPSVKKKPKLSEQIRMANIVSSSSASLISSPSLSVSPSPVPSKPKKKSLRALIEASASNQVSAGSASEDLLSGSATQSPAAGPLCSRTGTQARTKTKEIKDSVNPVALSTHTKSKGTSKKKVSVSKSKVAPATADSKGNECSERPKSHVWADAEEERAYLSGNEMLWKSGSAKITLQDVKTTLGRAKTGRTPTMGQIEMSHDLSNNSQTSKRPGLESYHKDVRSLEASELQKELTAVGRQKSEPASLPAAPLHLSPHVIRTTPPQLTVSRNDGLAGHHKTNGPSPSLNAFSSPLVSPLTAQTPTADEGLVVKKPQLEFRDTNAAGDGRADALTHRRLGQVRLRELPEWLAGKTPTHPGDVVEMMQRGWQWYYRKYVDVRKGGVGGVGMLIAGYCILSYVWSFPHIKRDRWRKYH